MSFNRLRFPVIAAALAICLVVIIGPALAADVQHGISFTKGCASPTSIGSPYVCSYAISNNVDEAHDTFTIDSLVDVVHAAGGDVPSGNILGAAQITTTTTATGSTPSGATCVASSGTGVAPSPYTGVTSCTLPFGSKVNVLGFSHYTVTAADYALSAHALRDDAFLSWNDLCNDPAGTGNQNCNPNPPNASAASQSVITKRPSTTTTSIHNAAHAAVTAVPAGTSVHDLVTVAGQAGQPAPTGNVNLDWFLNGTCSGSPAANSGSLGPLVGGQLDAVGFAFTVDTPGPRSFLAHYEGDGGYATSNGDCEPLQVVDASIQITPNGTNPVGSPHVFTAHVAVNAGGGAANAPDGTSISFAIDSGPGSFTTVNPCTTTGGTGSCQITLASAVTGVTSVSAHAAVSVGGAVVSLSTNGVGGNSGPATKRWVDANIQIAPAIADNPVGTNHVLTISVNALGGTLDAGPHAATASIVGGPGSFVGSPSCTYTGGAATASCTVTITSAAVGTTSVAATAAIPVSGVTVTRTTATAANTSAGGSGNAAKNWADATIVTHVRDTAGTDVTGAIVPSGTVVHDEAAVAKAAGTPAATPGLTGTVTFTLYNSGTCNGSVLAIDSNRPLASGTATSATFTAPAAGGAYSYRAHYNGDANYPARDAACEPFTVQTAPSGGLITETNVACGDVLSGAASNYLIDGINYPSSGGKIGQGINPGKFYFWTKITTTTPNQVVTVTQTNTSTNNAALFQVHQGWARIYTANCANWKAGTEINGGSGASFTVPAPGTYFIGIKYDPKSIVDTKVPVPATVKFEFKTSLGGTTGGSVLLRPNA